MNFDFSEDQKMLGKTAREFLAEHAPLRLCREVLESDASYSETLWREIGKLGWAGSTIPEQYGGAGFGRLELAVIAEEIGRALAPIPFGSSLYLAAEAVLEGGSEAQKEKYLPKLATGEWIGTFAHAEGLGSAGSEGLNATLASGKIDGVKIAVPDGEVAHFAVVSARAGTAMALALIDLSAPGVERSAVRCIDPSRSLAEIRFRGAPAEMLGTTETGAAIAAKVLDRAAVYTAFEQIGGAERALELTREFCLGRYAFGRPVASFQAIKHRLADLYVEIELARSNAYYGAWALEADAPELGVAACAARAGASDAFELATQEMVQLHGGVGYTWEYDCHLFYRRAKLLGVALGSSTEWRERLMQRLEGQAARA